ncbi:DegT/DnrJ/EryC1/StrS family aminotransferase [Agrococcus jenensis]|uniref:dTDP-4-amino-4,6-dideoxygalactose transaminase n=1 Tax=Agrococcus jenensis TaxID=46353 RepID=A0A3N2AQU8_9MICO|nr:DegT/DnrJ/EryC1/StrS family aminotransferase [Agrococcus jenensis]ROR65404.1 dTDP-4-amino-4,6-dideoxygalactose transaminase [Agrococcus jenensis]
MPDVVRFNDLRRGLQSTAPGVRDAIEEVLASGWFVLGPQHDAFERELAASLDIAAAAGVGNGTDALQLALQAVGARPGTAVITVANAGGYTSTATRAIGATPWYADVDPATLQATPATVNAALRSAPMPVSAIVVTHLFGQMADARGIVEAANGVPVVEDCAQAMGARSDGRAAGTFGTVATTSFYPTKNLGAVGDGGAVFSDDVELVARIRQLRQYGWSSKYRSSAAGGRNSRLDELQAAVLRRLLPALDADVARRREIHARYEAAASGRIRMVNRATPSYAGHLAVVVVDDRQRVTAILDDHGIGHDIHYPLPDHHQPIAEPEAPPLPVTEWASEHIISVPLYAGLTDDEQARVVAALHEMS